MSSAKPARPYVVRNSSIHGRGVFAARPIEKGTRIIEYKGERVSWRNALKRPDSDPDNPFHTFFFSLEDGRVIDAGVGGNAARWINHSCGPNCETKEDGEGRVFIYAKKDIAPGDELTYDYSLTVDGRLTKEERAWFTCHCGKKACRGTMLDRKGKAKKR
jgi:SET domain-containing protein